MSAHRPHICCACCGRGWVGPVVGLALALLVAGAITSALAEVPAWVWQVVPAVVCSAVGAGLAVLLRASLAPTRRPTAGPPTARPALERDRVARTLRVPSERVRVERPAVGRAYAVIADPPPRSRTELPR